MKKGAGGQGPGAGERKLASLVSWPGKIRAQRGTFPRPLAPGPRPPFSPAPFSAPLVLCNG